ncbi:hypothetical protein B0H16DRAFT_1006743 [Mycena metata]|uniref:Uncharacterized protein n=1 Tax=Mycena metata TaxID=1033252 RepID=A0AAD7K4A8_9AGAR|nr:hypothetical protein B0H16DRAFT_1006743 [Mycena metata]
MHGGTRWCTLMPRQCTSPCTVACSTVQHRALPCTTVLADSSPILIATAEVSLHSRLPHSNYAVRAERWPFRKSRSPSKILIDVRLLYFFSIHSERQRSTHSRGLRFLAAYGAPWWSIFCRTCCNCSTSSWVVYFLPPSVFSLAANIYSREYYRLHAE